MKKRVILVVGPEANSERISFAESLIEKFPEIIFLKIEAEGISVNATMDLAKENINDVSDIVLFDGRDLDLLENLRCSVVNLKSYFKKIKGINEGTTALDKKVINLILRGGLMGLLNPDME